MRRLPAGALIALLSLPVHATEIPVGSVDRDAAGVTLHMQPGTLRLLICTDRIVRVVYAPSASLPKLEDMVIKAKWTPVPFRLQEGAQAVTIATERLQIRVDKGDGAIHFLDKTGKVLLEEPACGGKATPAVTVNKETAISPACGMSIRFSPANRRTRASGQPISRCMLPVREGISVHRCAALDRADSAAMLAGSHASHSILSIS